MPESLTGRLPGQEAFEAEFPGSDLVSAQLARAFERIGIRVQSAVASVWRRYGLSHAAGNALAVIEGAGHSMTPGEIGAAMHVTSGSITSLVDTLVKLELVDRATHPDDRRKVQVSLRPEGVAVLDQALPEVLQVVKRLFGGLQPAERHQLLALLALADASIADADLEDLPPSLRVHPAHD